MVQWDDLRLDIWSSWPPQCTVKCRHSWQYSDLLIVFSQDGVWVKGLYLEGAGWEKKASCLVEANPMQLVCPMPTIHFKPVESKRRSAKGKIFYTTAYLLRTSQSTTCTVNCKLDSQYAGMQGWHCSIFLIHLVRSGIELVFPSSSCTSSHRFNLTM